MVDTLTTIENVKSKVLTEVQENERKSKSLSNTEKKAVFSSPPFILSKSSLPSTPSLMTGKVNDIELIFQGILLSPEHTVGDYHIISDSILFCRVKQVCACVCVCLFVRERVMEKKKN
jgi:hypothetical protein